MSSSYVYIVIALCAAVTLAEKIAPFFALGGRKIDPGLEKWLGFIPAAVLAAFLAPSMLVVARDGGPAIDISFANPIFWAGIPALAVACWKKSFFGSIAIGMATVALMRLM